MRNGVHISVTLLLIYPPSSKLTNYLDNIFNKTFGHCLLSAPGSQDRRGQCQEERPLPPSSVEFPG